MNSVEISLIKGCFGDDWEDKTMDDYFEHDCLSSENVDLDELKKRLKDIYSDETEWSF